MAWTAEAQKMVAALDAVGIKATLDPRKVNPPCALIVPPTLTRVVGKGLYASWNVYLVAPAPADLDSIKWLLDNLEAAFEAVRANTAEFANLTITPDAGDMPAYTLTVIAHPL